MVSIIISAVIAVFAIVILYLTRSNIIDLLDRDVIMYDQNYQLKKESLQEAFDCLDMVAQNGVEIKANAQFIARAKEAYNALLCTVSNAKIYQEFYAKAIDTTVTSCSAEEIEKFKIACRAELLRKRKGEGFKGSTIGMFNGGGSAPASQPVRRPAPARPAQPRPAQPAQPVQRQPGQTGPQNKDN